MASLSIGTSLSLSFGLKNKTVSDRLGTRSHHGEDASMFHVHPPRTLFGLITAFHTAECHDIQHRNAGAAAATVKRKRENIRPCIGYLHANTPENPSPYQLPDEPVHVGLGYISYLKHMKNAVFVGVVSVRGSISYAEFELQNLQHWQ